MMTLKILKGLWKPHDCTHFLLIGRNKWGRGETIEEALKAGQMKAKEVEWVCVGDSKCRVNELGDAKFDAYLWSQARSEK